MKKIKIIIIIGIVLLNVLVGYMLSQGVIGDTDKYNDTLAQARAYAEKELCEKAINEYMDALSIEDSVELRTEIIGVYEKAVEIGEFTSTYEMFEQVNSLVERYSENSYVYEYACEFLYKYEKYEECADFLMQAQKLEVSSDKLNEITEKVRYKYTKVYAMYSDVSPEYDNMYLTVSDGIYSFLNDECGNEISYNYTYASSFSEGYAFVKSLRPDGTEDSYIIDKNNVRQAYIEGAETSSGIGKAKDTDNKDILLLACKVGDVYSYYDINGNKVFGEYAFAGRFRNNVAAVKDSDGNWLIIDGSGSTISDTVFSDVVLNEFDECAPKGVIFAAIDGVYYLYDLTVTQIGDFSCDEAKAFVDDYAAYRAGGFWGYVGTDGSIIIGPQYEDAKSFSNGVGAVKTGERWYLINYTNQNILEETFEEIKYVSDKGICFVKTGGYWSYIRMFYTGN